MDKATEKLLISRAKKGELTAFEELTAAYEHRIFVLAYRYCGEEQAAQSLAQDVFLDAYRSIKSFRGDSGFAAWLYRLAVQRCAAFRRAEQNDPAQQDTPEAEKPSADPLEEIFASLSAEQRLLLLLRDVAGLTYAEIAPMLSLEDNAVRTRLSHARRQLRDLLRARQNAVPVEGRSDL